jgi:hypothetical protein
MNGVLKRMWKEMPLEYFKELSDSFNRMDEVRDQVLHPYRATGKITVLYILIFTFFDSRREDRRFWAEC